MRGKKEREGKKDIEEIKRFIQSRKKKIVNFLAKLSVRKVDGRYIYWDLYFAAVLAINHCIAQIGNAFGNASAGNPRILTTMWTATRFDAHRLSWTTSLKDYQRIRRFTALSVTRGKAGLEPLA